MRRAKQHPTDADQIFSNFQNKFTPLQPSFLHSARENEIDAAPPIELSRQEECRAAQDHLNGNNSAGEYLEVEMVPSRRLTLCHVLFKLPPLFSLVCFQIPNATTCTLCCNISCVRCLESWTAAACVVFLRPLLLDCQSSV